MTGFTERRQTGAFIILEAPGHLSRDSGVMASGEDCAAGELLMASAGKLVAWDGDGDVVGILLASTNATSDTAVTYLARAAEVNFDLLTYPEDTDAETALAAIGIVTHRSGAAIPDNALLLNGQPLTLHDQILTLGA